MTLRVVQWATGNIGTYALRSVIEHPQLDLAGVYVYTPAKAGRDAGELCGLDPVGVAATRDIEVIVDLGADCVLYMPARCDFDEVCRLLASGANVVASGRTDMNGQITFYLDSGTAYFWRQKSGFNFTNPDTEIVP